MDTERFLREYNEPRNGVNQFYFNRLYPRLKYSDGVRDLAALGIGWLLDIAGTEGVDAYVKAALAHDGVLGQAYFGVEVKGSTALITLKAHVEVLDAGMAVDSEGLATLFERTINYTDIPEGNYLFYFGQDAQFVPGSSRESVIMCLRSED